MNKARAMLDALMGPGRDVAEKGNKKEKFKESSVCKSFLVGFCPLDPSMLGGKRKFDQCQRIHSELMKEQLQAHPEKEKLQKDYEILFLRDLEFAVRECDGHIANERQRIREDVRKRKAPLPVDVNARLSQMKREAEGLLAQAKTLDDDKLREKESMEARAKEIMTDREGYMEAETKKAAANIVPEEVCEVCGTAYEGEEDRKNHMKFKVHVAYVKIRDTIKQIKASTEETEKKKREDREAELKRKRKEEWEAAAAKDKGSGDKDDDKEKDTDRDKEKDGDKDRDRNRDRDKEKDGDKDRDRKRDRDKDKDGDKDRERNRDRDREKDGEKDKDRNRDRDKGRDRERDKSRGKDKERERSRGGDRSKGKGRDASRDRSRDGRRSRSPAKRSGRGKDRSRSRSRSRRRRG